MGEKRATAAILFATLAFGSAVFFRDVVNPWLSTTAAALVTLVLAGGQARTELCVLVGTPRRAVLFAIAVGLLLAIATHIAYGLAVRYAPALTAGVPNLYSTIEAAPGPRNAIPLVVVIVFAEEVVWRGLVVDVLQRRLGRLPVFVVAVMLYVLPQIAGGSWELVAIATVLGGIFGWQRLATGRVSDPFITHLVWSIAIFSLFPVVDWLSA